MDQKCDRLVKSRDLKAIDRHSPKLKFQSLPSWGIVFPAGGIVFPAGGIWGAKGLVLSDGGTGEGKIGGSISPELGAVGAKGGVRLVGLGGVNVGFEGLIGGLIS